MNSLVFVLFCSVFLVVQQEIGAINCYICDPGTDGCGPSFKKNGGGVLPMSDSSAAYCTKLVVTNNNNAVERSYSASGTCTEGSSTSSDGINNYQYCCTTELCNGALMPKANFIFVLISSVIILLLIK